MRLFLRVEASPSVGLGHLRRSVALAEVAAERRITTTWVTSSWAADLDAFGPPAFVDRVDDLDSRAWIRHVDDGDMVWIDGQSFPDFGAEIRARGARVGRIEDTGSGTFDADVLVDPDDSESGVTSSSGGVVLAGLRYALVRTEFRAVSRRIRAENPVLVAFGGTDVASLTEPACRALIDAGVQVSAVVGPDVPRPPEVEVHDQPVSVADIVCRSSVLVGAAGNMVVEAAACGVPSVFVVVAPNQERLARSITEANLGMRVSEAFLGVELPRLVAESRRPDRHEASSAALRDLVDGQGAFRVLDALQGVDT